MVKEKNEKTSEPEVSVTEEKNTKETHVVVEMPEEVVIKLVQENLVKNYETLVWLFNASTSIAAGLWVAFITVEPRWFTSLFFSAAGITVLSIVLIVLIIINRKSVFSNPVRKRMRITEFHKVF